MTQPNDNDTDDDDSEFETVEIEMEDSLKEHIQEIADLAKVSFDQVIAVILAKQIIDNADRENERE